jgi:hypothetical protein
MCELSSKFLAFLSIRRSQNATLYFTLKKKRIIIITILRIEGENLGRISVKIYLGLVGGSSDPFVTDDPSLSGLPQFTMHA